MDEVNALLAPFAGPDYSALTTLLQQRGWYVPSWPREWGGCDWPPRQKFLWYCALARRGIRLPGAVAVDIAGPALLRYAPSVVQTRYLPGIRDGAEVWQVAALAPTAALPELVDGGLLGEVLTDGTDGVYVLTLAARAEEVVLLAFAALDAQRQTFVGLDGAERSHYQLDGVSPRMELTAVATPRMAELLAVLAGHDYVSLGALGGLQGQLATARAWAARVDADDAWQRALQAEAVALSGVNAMYLRYVDALQRGVPEPFPLQVLNLRTAPLRSRLAQLSRQAADYYGMVPSARSGANEPSVLPPLDTVAPDPQDPFAPGMENDVARHLRIELDDPLTGSAERDAVAALLWPEPSEG